MEKGDKISVLEGEISIINQLIKALGKQVERLEAAYKNRDHREFNFLKKQVIQTQKRIHSFIK